MLICPQCRSRFEDAERVECPSDGTELLMLGDPAEDPRIGTVLADRYLLLSVLGAGGMGVVYDAWQISTARNVAIKVMHVGDRSPDVRARVAERFKREARVTASLRSPHTVTIHDFDQLPGGELYIVMKRLEGEPLDALLERRGALGLSEVRGIAVQVCESLIEAHANGIVHRDLKPANIMLEPLGKRGEWHVTVLDFGIAKVLDERTPSLTETGLTIGTFNYMPPEQAEGKPVGPAADIYALGATLFHMLTGDVVFPSNVPLAVMNAHCRTPPPRLFSQLADTVPVRAFDAVVQRCLEKEPARRYPSTSDLKEALAALVLEAPARSPILAPTRPAEEALPAADAPVARGRHRWMVATGMLGLAAATVALGFVVADGRSAGTTGGGPGGVERGPDAVGGDGASGGGDVAPEAVQGVSGATPIGADREGGTEEATDVRGPEDGRAIVDEVTDVAAHEVTGGAHAHDATSTPDATTARRDVVEGARHGAATIRGVQIKNGDLTASEVTSAFAGIRGALSGCYDKAGAAATGPLQISLYVSASGDVLAANVLGPSGADVTAFSSCALPPIRSVSFAGTPHASASRVTIVFGPP